MSNYVEAVRKRLDRWGLKVQCLVCRYRTRHFSRTQGRLRARSCPDCGSQWSLRSEAWILKNEASAALERAKLCKLYGVSSEVGRFMAQGGDRGADR